jgi:predicted RNA binding protein YcfA (HicA-like mRNA interferase family)
MSGLPPQVTWRRFLHVLAKLGYTAQRAKLGSARSFRNPTRKPNVVTFREPRPGQDVRPTGSREYLRKLGVARDEFIQLVRDC